jgi:hypothetical protein
VLLYHSPLTWRTRTTHSWRPPFQLLVQRAQILTQGAREFVLCCRGRENLCSVAGGVSICALLQGPSIFVLLYQSPLTWRTRRHTRGSLLFRKSDFSDFCCGCQVSGVLVLSYIQAVWRRPPGRPDILVPGCRFFQAADISGVRCPRFVLYSRCLETAARSTRYFSTRLKIFQCQQAT